MNRGRSFGSLSHVILLGLFSLVVLLAHALHPDHLPTRHAAWYLKAEPTFVDALAAVRRHLWEQLNVLDFSSIQSEAFRKARFT